MMKIKKPVFFAAPRSRSTALMTLAAPFSIGGLNLISLNDQSEFFREYSHRYFIKDTGTNFHHKAEYFPLNRKNNTISHHFMYPAVYPDKKQRNGHKIQVLNQEKKEGREYFLKIMSHDIETSLMKEENKDRTWSRGIIDFFSDRSFVITRRRDVKGLAFSLLVAAHTDMWHKRENNKERYENLYKNPIYIDEQLCVSISKDLISVKMMDMFEDHISKSGYEYNTFYYEDLTTLQDMKDALDQVFGNRIWQDFLDDRFLEEAMPKPLNLDYRKIISNYDHVEKIVDDMLENIFG